QQVGVVDVGLAFEHPKPEAWQIPSDAGQGHIDHRRVEKHDAGPKHRGNQDPSAPVGHLPLLPSWQIVKPAAALEYSYGHHQCPRAPEPDPPALQSRPKLRPDRPEGAKRPDQPW